MSLHYLYARQPTRERQAQHDHVARHALPSCGLLRQRPVAAGTPSAPAPRGAKAYRTSDGGVHDPLEARWTAGMPDAHTP